MRHFIHSVLPPLLQLQQVHFRCFGSPTSLLPDPDCGPLLICLLKYSVLTLKGLVHDPMSLPFIRHCFLELTSLFECLCEGKLGLLLLAAAEGVASLVEVTLHVDGVLSGPLS